jgi:hypothetical protein
MLHLTVPVTPGLPVLWWVWWFAVAAVVYGVIAIWFRSAARRHDEAASQAGKIGSEET